MTLVAVDDLTPLLLLGRRRGGKRSHNLTRRVAPTLGDLAIWRKHRDFSTFALLLIVTIAHADKNGGEFLSVAEHLVAQWRMHSFKK